MNHAEQTLADTATRMKKLYTAAAVGVEINAREEIDNGADVTTVFETYGRL